MSNKLFYNLRKKLTLQYSFVFGIAILAIVFATYAFTWWSMLAIEKQELVAKAVHEGEEWVTSKEAPVNAKELANGDILAYFVEPDGKTVILNQLGTADVGKAILKKRGDWPTLDGRQTRLLRCHDEKRTKHFRYLATVCQVKDKGRVVGHLYMFENMDTYYSAGIKTLQTLALLLAALFILAACGGYWLAGRNLKPIFKAYEKQKQFTADASHEIRTPLAVMKLGVQGIQEDEENKLSSFSTDTLLMLEQEVDRLTRLTENLMTLARNDNEGYSPEQTKILLSDMALQVAKQLQLVASEKEITIQHNIEPKVSLVGNAASINRLFIILLDNAIKYSPNGTTITLEVTSSKNSLLIKVADQGLGIKEQDKKRIFDRFYRVDKARSRSMGGLGLGLALAKAIVEHHHGDIWVEDNSPKGSIFIVQLPHKN